MVSKQFALRTIRLDHRSLGMTQSYRKNKQLFIEAFV
jgi:hypothetical protein